MARTEINPQVLQWALNDSARTVADLQAATLRPQSEVVAWLSGRSHPHMGDLRKMASLLGRSPYFFALPAPPQGKTYAAKFRSAMKKTVGPEERAIELSALRWAQRRQALARRLIGDSTEYSPFQPGDDPRDAAAAARNWLDWDTSFQVKASSKTSAFRALRAAVEDRGILVVHRSGGTDQFCGFSLPDDSTPLIYVNKDYELASVRSYTLLHELAHVLLGQRRVCYGGDKGVERWCNRFAAEFLMPIEHLVAYLDKQKIKFESATDTDPVRRVANRYKTSWLAAAIRLEELGRAPSGLADHVRNSRPETADDGFLPGGRSTPVIRLDENGATLTRAIAQALDEGNYSELDARRLFDVDGKQLAATISLARDSRQ
jgi:Zn-dependent peptidase ImmA (M78 family)